MNQNITEMLGKMVHSVSGASSAVVTAGDGLCLSYVGLDRDDADKLAASVSSLYALNNQIGATFGGGRMQQHSAQFDDAVLAIMGAGSNTMIAVLGAKDTDLGMLGFNMKRLGEQITQYLHTPRRQTAAEQG